MKISYRKKDGQTYPCPHCGYEHEVTHGFRSIITNEEIVRGNKVTSSIAICSKCKEYVLDELIVESDGKSIYSLTPWKKVSTYECITKLRDVI